MPGYDATALIAEPQFGVLAMCLVDDRILQIRAGIVTPGNDVGVNWREQALDTLVSSRLHNPPLQVSHWMRLAMGKFVADYTVLSRCVIPSPESSISAYRREAFVTAIIGIFV
jgi:hypothetical protein